uniref:Uncharacterized protein n=1 Tax=Salix viminalis TaxID=40686 RepID=A0A6N2N2M5_SALVM
MGKKYQINRLKFQNNHPVRIKGSILPLSSKQKTTTWFKKRWKKRGHVRSGHGRYALATSTSSTTSYAVPLSTSTSSDSSSHKMSKTRKLRILMSLSLVTSKFLQPLLSRPSFCKKIEEKKIDEVGGAVVLAT